MDGGSKFYERFIKFTQNWMSVLTLDKGLFCAINPRDGDDAKMIPLTGV